MKMRIASPGPARPGRGRHLRRVGTGPFRSLVAPKPEVSRAPGLSSPFIVVHVHDHESGFAILGDEHGLIGFGQSRGHFRRMILEIADRLDLR